MTETLTNGTLGSIVPASYPANAEGTPANQFNAISCSSPGYCTAAGQYKDASNDYEAMIETETNNSWGTIQKATFATGIHGTLPLDEFSAISCWSAGDCTAAGEFQNAGAHTEDMTATLSNGTLSNANTANFASGVESTSTPYSGLSSISCVSAGNCTAAGSFTDAGGNDESMTLTESNGTWSNAHPTTFESGVQNSAPHDYLVSVFCSSAGNCTAAGQFKDAGGNNEAMTVTSTNGTWADAVPASFASGVDSSTPDDYFLAVSCSATGDCTAAGYFQNHSNDEQAMSQTLTLVTNTPTTTTNTPTTTTTSAVASSAPRPVVTIASKTAALKKSSIAVLVQCASATCGGVAQLFSTKILKKTTIVIRKGKRTLKTVSTKVKVILAQNSYSVASGKSLSLSLKVLKSGLVFLSTVSAKKPVYETITVTVSGGTAATELFKVT